MARRLTAALVAVTALSLGACGGTGPSSKKTSDPEPSSNGFGSAVATIRGMGTPGAATDFVHFERLPGLDFKVAASRTTSGWYDVTFRNRYTKAISISYVLRGSPPAESTDRHTIGAGKTYETWFKPAKGFYETVYFRIDRVRFGDDSGPYYKPEEPGADEADALLPDPQVVGDDAVAFSRRVADDGADPGVVRIEEESTGSAVAELSFSAPSDDGSSATLRIVEAEEDASDEVQAVSVVDLRDGLRDVVFLVRDDGRPAWIVGDHVLVGERPLDPAARLRILVSPGLSVHRQPASGR
jgi:hypothetical protein